MGVCLPFFCTSKKLFLSSIELVHGTTLKYYVVCIILLWSNITMVYQQHLPVPSFPCYPSCSGWNSVVVWYNKRVSLLDNVVFGVLHIFCWKVLFQVQSWLCFSSILNLCKKESLQKYFQELDGKETVVPFLRSKKNVKKNYKYLLSECYF